MLSLGGHHNKYSHTRMCCLSHKNVKHIQFEFSRTNFVLLAKILDGILPIIKLIG